MCEFCKTDELGDAIGEYLIDSKQDGFFLFANIFPNFSTLSVSANYKSEEIMYRHRKINYCPMCGRKL